MSSQLACGSGNITGPGCNRRSQPVHVGRLIDNRLAIVYELICGSNRGKRVDVDSSRIGNRGNLGLTIAAIKAGLVVRIEKAVEPRSINENVRGAVNRECQCRSRNIGVIEACGW